MLIKHLKHKEIDFNRWDNTVAQSVGKLPYAQSWFLNIVSPGWEALVDENYTYLMPLPVKSKFKVNYMVQPVYTQQLGVFSNVPVSEEIIKQFISKIPYLSYQFHLNENNPNSEAISYPNFVLNLGDNYENIAAKFAKNTIRNIEKAKLAGIQVSELKDTDEIIDFYTSESALGINLHLNLLKDLVKTGLQKRQLCCMVARNKDQKIIAAVCLLLSESRLVYLLPISNDEAKASSAMFLIIDSLIRGNSESNKLLDFEGSRIQGVARFYKGFGAVNRPYCLVKKYRPDFLIGKF